MDYNNFKRSEDVALPGLKNNVPAQSSSAQEANPSDAPAPEENAPVSPAEGEDNEEDKVAGGTLETGELTITSEGENDDDANTSDEDDSPSDTQENGGGDNPDEPEPQNLPSKEKVDEVMKKLLWLEEKLPLFEKTYSLTGDYVGKINNLFNELFKNLLLFEESKIKIQNLVKNYRVYLDLKDEDKKDLEERLQNLIYQHDATVKSHSEEIQKLFEEEISKYEEHSKQWSISIVDAMNAQLERMKTVNEEIIQKVKVNTSFLDKIEKIKKEYLMAFFAFTVAGTVVLTILVTYLLQMK